MREFSYGAIESATNGFAVENLIGKGSHGVVYRGSLDNGTPVAVKKPSAASSSAHGAGDAKIRNEIAILASAAADCPCIVGLVGAGRDSAGQPFLVMQLMPNGSLRDALRSPSAAPPSWPRRVETALRVARAVASLHGASPPVVHRDVKSENVLFDAAWGARLADFSLAVRVGDSHRTGLAPAGTIGYLDPSYTESKLLSPKNDVFSFGVLLLELVSSRKVMDADSDPCSIVAWAVPMIRARRYDEVVDRRVAGTERSAVARILRVAARCAAEKAEERPGMGEVVRELEGVVDDCVSWWWARHGISISWCSIVIRNYRIWRRRRRVGTRRIVCKDHLVGGGGGGGEFDLDLDFDLEFRKNHS